MAIIINYNKNFNLITLSFYNYTHLWDNLYVGLYNLVHSQRTDYASKT